MISQEDKEFLQKARERFAYCHEQWRDIREQADLDARFLAGDSWDEREKQKRKDRNIPAIHLDEITQFINQLVNDVRQNKRAVKVMPKGGGATNQTGSLRADWIRSVEYDSQGQSAYITAFESAAGRSYGFWKLETYYDNPNSFDLSARIMPIVNPNTIIFDPDCKQYDCSDAEDCFEIDFISHDAFKRKYPDAEIAEFTDDIRQQDLASEWIKDQQVQIASWWRVVVDKIQLHLVDAEGSKQPVVMRSTQLPENLDRQRILKSRDYDDRRIVQYLINGVEILQTNDPRKGKGWPGKWIPIIPVWGKELYIDEGSGSRRMLFSLIRMARDPQRLLDYYASQEMIEAKMTPKVPYVGPKGMFSNQAEQWESLNEEGRAWVEYEIPDGFQPGSIKPERVPFVPNFQQYELAKEACKRHIMSAMGIAPLPTAAQRNNEKSGVALSKIQGERAQGSFHFIDNYDRSLEYSGRQLDDLFDIIHDMPRDIALRKEDGTHEMARVNDPGHKLNKEYKGEHSVTITTGPSYESQREEAAEFTDTLASVPGVFPLIGDLIVRMRALGPIGDQIAERLTPPQFADLDGTNLPDIAKNAIGQVKQQLQQATAAVAQLQQEKAAKMWEMDGKLQIEKIHSDTQKAVAEINTKAQLLNERIKALEDLQADFHQMAHDTALSAQEHQQTLQQGQQAAALAPQPDSSNNGGGAMQ
jgi:hypothetical protein